MRRTRAFDMPLLLCFLILVGLGIAFIYSASYPKAMALTETGGNSFYYTARQIIFAVLGVFAMFACMSIPMQTFQRLSGVIIGLCLLLLVAVLVIGAMKHGNRAFIEIGPVQFQPSEFAKAGLIVALAAYLARRPWSLKSWRGLANGPLWFVVVPLGLIVAERDLGTALVFMVAALIFLATAGTKFRFWFPALVMMVGVGALMVVCSSRKERLRAWREPFNPAIEQSYQPRNSLIAVGSGGLLGRGFCQSRQKWFYLPGAHNDYIMAIIAEELGFLKILVLLFLPYLFVIYRGFTIAHRAPDEFSALVATGCTVMLGTQALINMAVVLNLIPPMGINLPFISYGGSSVVASMMMAGLLLNVSRLRFAREVARSPQMSRDAAAR